MILETRQVKCDAHGTVRGPKDEATDPDLSQGHRGIATDAQHDRPDDSYDRNRPPSIAGDQASNEAKQDGGRDHVCSFRLYFRKRSFTPKNLQDAAQINESRAVTHLTVTCNRSGTSGTSECGYQ